MAQVLITQTTPTGMQLHTEIVNVQLGVGKLLEMTKAAFIRIMEDQSFNFNPLEHEYKHHNQTGLYYDAVLDTIVTATLLV